jgi:PAS domain S-box-containing protein
MLLAALSARPARWRAFAFGVCGTALALQLALAALPLPDTLPAANAAAVHLLMELFAIVVGALLLAVTWHTFEIQPGPEAGVLLAGFTVVVGCDTLHALTYAGMPSFLGEADPERAIFFWLMGRAAEAATLAVLAAGVVRRTWPRGTALAGGALGVAVLVIWDLQQLAGFPDTFVTGQGLTGFKVGFEGLLALVNVAAGALLWRRSQHEAPERGEPFRLMAMSAWLVAIGAISFSSYTRPNGLENLLGHLFKILAYGFLYAATFASSVRAPLRALHEARLDAERSREQLAGIVETAMDAIVTVDAAQRIRVFNGAAARMFGWPREAVLGQPLGRLVPEAHRAVHEAHVRGFAAGEEALRMMAGERRLWAQRADGSLFPVSVSISRFGSGEQTLMTAVVRDVSRERELEQVRAAQLAAEEASRAKSRFISRVSHELRTPLNAILGTAQLLLAERGEPLSPAQRQRVQLGRQAGEHLLRLVDDLLDAAQIESGQLRTERLAVPVSDVVDDALRLAGPVAAGAGVQLRADPASDLNTLALADPFRLRQVLINLLSNGIKYNRAGGRVDVRWHTDADGVCVEVADDGLGMDAEQLAQLFQPFNRVGRERSAIQGAGLGLALTRQLVQAMGGDLQVDSEPGRGTRMRVRLQPAPAGAPRPPKAAAPEPLPAAAGGELAGTLLYVEDNPVNMALVEGFVSLWPRLRLLQARDGASGLALAREHRPDLVLLDMQLPDMDGHAVLRALRSDPVTRTLPVVAVSASAMASEIAAAREAGAVDYITKPVDFAALEAHLRRHARRPAPA